MTSQALREKCHISSLRKTALSHTGGFVRTVHCRSDAILTGTHRLHQNDAIPTDCEAEAMLVFLDDDTALNKTWGVVRKKRVR